MFITSDLYKRLFALIHAIECDINYILNSIPREGLENSNLETLAEKTINESDAVFDATLAQKLSCLQRLNKNNFVSINSTIFKSTDALIKVRNRVFHARPLEYGDSDTIYCFVNNAIKHAAKYFPTLIHAKHSLTSDEKEYLHNLDISFEECGDCLHNIPDPDFYETGFIGRKKLRKSLQKDILVGAYPAITLVGQGGIGKTALAQRVVWDIVEHPHNPFEIIIWTTAKRTQLIGFEIKPISSNINSGTDVFSEAFKILDDSQKEDAKDQLHKMLSEFKCLLVVDNLETILDDQIRWLCGNIPKGSKALFTSRVQLAAGDKPIIVDSMLLADSRNLFKAFAGSSNLPHYARMSDKEIDSILKILQNNPLFIKWYLQAINTGCTPQEIMNSRETIVEFCMKNVFDNISGDEKHLLDTFLCTRPPHTYQKLSYVSGLQGHPLEDSIKDLARRNIISEMVANRENIYEILMLPKSFAIQSKFVKAAVASTLLKRENKYKSEMLNASVDTAYDYNPKFVFLDKEENLFSSRKVKSAGVYISRKEYDTALSRLEDAKELSPQYFEIYRVKGFCLSQLDDYLGARDAYETAVTLYPNYAPLRYFFASFLLDSDDLDGAETEARMCVKFDSKSAYPKIILGRILTYKRRYREAIEQLNSVDKNVMYGYIYIIYADRVIDAHCRLIESLATKSEFEEGHKYLIHLAKYLSDTSEHIIDERAREKIGKIGRSLDEIRRALPQNISSTPFDVLDKYTPIRNPTFVHQGKEQPFSFGEVLFGTVIDLKVDERYGFIGTSDSNNTNNWFFHANYLDNISSFDSIVIGSKVEFVKGKNSQGECAKHVRLLP